MYIFNIITMYNAEYPSQHYNGTTSWNGTFMQILRPTCIDIDYDNIYQCLSTFLLQRNPTEVWRSLTEPHSLIHESSYVREVEATACLRTHFPSRPEPPPPEEVKQAKMTNMKLGRICRQQYVIVFNQTRRAMRSSMAA